MSLLVVGSVAFDAVETPFGKCEKMLGGSASHFSISASFFTDVSIVGVVGGDFTEADGEVFKKLAEIEKCDAEPPNIFSHLPNGVSTESNATEPTTKRDID